MSFSIEFQKKQIYDSLKTGFRLAVRLKFRVRAFSLPTAALRSKVTRSLREF